MINLSLSGRSLVGMRELYQACDEAASSGAVVVAAGDRLKGGYPSSFDNVVGVEGELGASRFGYGLSSAPRLDVSANITNYITIPVPVAKRTPVTGATYAAPVISGIIALLRERALTASESVKWLQNNPSLK